MNNTVNVSTVRDLKDAIAALPDDRLVLSQVAATDGTSWSMRCVFIRCVQGGNVAGLSMSHPDLYTLLPKSAEMDWGKAKTHFETCMATYMWNPENKDVLMRDMSYYAIVQRYGNGERTRELYDAMMAVE